MGEITSVFTENPGLIVAIGAVAVICIFMIIKKLIKIAVGLFVIFIVVLIILTQLGIFKNSDISEIGDKIQDRVEDVAK